MSMGKPSHLPNAPTFKAPIHIRIIALETASFPATARVRVLEVKQGPYRLGQIIRVLPAPGSVCGPDRILKDQQGMIASMYLPKRKTDPVPFSGFIRDPKAK